MSTKALSIKLWNRGESKWKWARERDWLDYYNNNGATQNYYFSFLVLQSLVQDVNLQKLDEIIE